MIVNDLYILSIALFPGKADPQLVINADTVLALTIATKLLKAVTRRRAQIIEGFSSVQHGKLTQHDTTKVGREAPDGLAVKEPLSVAIGEALDHDV